MWRVSGECFWVVDCTTDHADSWLMTMSKRRSRVQGCWHVLSPADWSRTQEVGGFRQTVHAAGVSRSQKSLSTVRRPCLQSRPRCWSANHPTRHPYQAPLKQCTTELLSKYSVINLVTRLRCVEIQMVFFQHPIITPLLSYVSKKVMPKVLLTKCNSHNV